MFAIRQPRGLELQHSPWIILAWIGKEHISHRIVVAPIVLAPEGIILNLNSVTYINAPATKVAIVTHYTGQNDEGISIVG
eukprot:4029591-Heterocapsa_arctica.AAC.1